MKKIAIFCLTILIAFALTACGANDDEVNYLEEDFEQTELVLGSLWPIGPDLQRAISSFNRDNPDIYIRVLEYGNWESDILHVAQRLNTDIISGNMPDILLLEGLPFEIYAHRGFLADIGALIDADAELSRGDLVEGFLRTLEVNDTLYAVASGFFIRTAIGRSEIVGFEKGWTMSEFLDATEKMPEGMLPFPPSFGHIDFIQDILGMNIAQFIDYETGLVSFDTALFRDYLTFMDISSADEEMVEALPDSDKNPAISGEALVNHAFLWRFSDLSYFRLFGRDFNNLGFYEGDLTLIGYPSETGLGSFLRPLPETMLAISANSPHTEAAWRFVRTFLTGEQQPGHSDFSINRAVFEQRAEEAQGRYIGDDATWPVLSQDIEQILELVAGLDQRAIHDLAINEMIMEEVLPFLAGDRSKEDTIRILQNRVQTFISERT